MDLKKVLVVDDEPDIVEALRIMLTDEGYTIVTDNGKAVEKKILAEKPDVVVLDVLLSGENGGEITRKLKSQESTKHVPVILMSAHPNARKITQDTGASAFIAKPFEIEDMVNLIKKAHSNV